MYVAVYVEHRVVLYKLQRQVDGRTGQCNENGRFKQLRAFGEFAQRVDGHQACHQLHDDEFIRVFHHHGTCEHHGGVGDESRSRVGEHAYEDGHHGKRQNIDGEKYVPNHQRHQNGEKGYHGIEHGNGAWLFEIVAPEEREVAGEQGDEDEHKDGLPQDGGGDGIRHRRTALRFLYIRVEHPCFVGTHLFATVYDFLVSLHHTVGSSNATDQFVAFRFAFVFVVNNVWLDVFVKVASVQLYAIGRERFVVEQCFIGRTGREDAVHQCALCFFSFHQANHAGRV